MSWRGKAHSESGGGGHDAGGMMRWLLTYSDMITLLVVFFIIMYAQARVDNTRFAQIAISMRKAFNVEVLEGLDAPSPLPGFGASGALRTDALEYISEEMERMAAAEGAADEVGVGLAREGVVVSFSGNLLFRSGRADITPAGKRILAKLAAYLRTKPNYIRVEGHTDSTPIETPEFPSNWELSSARALAVVHYFIDEEGLPASRFSAAAFADNRPLTGNVTKEERARNRRADVVILDATELSSEALWGEPTPSPRN